METAESCTGGSAQAMQEAVQMPSLSGAGGVAEETMGSSVRGAPTEPQVSEQASEPTTVGGDEPCVVERHHESPVRVQRKAAARVAETTAEQPTLGQIETRSQLPVPQPEETAPLKEEEQSPLSSTFEERGAETTRSEMAAQDEDRDKQRPALSSDTSSIDSASSSSSTVSSTTTEPTPTPAPAPVAAPKQPAVKAKSRDSSLRIFFPTDDLALRAILSPPTVRAASSVVGPAAAAAQENATRPSLAESFLEQTSRLFFLRGNSSSSITSAASNPQTPAQVATVASQTTATSPPPEPRPSTTSIALEDDLFRLQGNSNTSTNTSTSAVVASNPNLPPPPFANMFACENCHDDIGSLLGQGRHHCRNCGGSFCAACSSKTSIVPYQLYLSKGEQRVCDGCFNRIRDFHAQAHTTQIPWSGLPPPSSDVLAMEFDLPAHEVPVTVFSCSYFVDFAPFYGHLFLTREHVCFRGYKTHKIKIAFGDLHSLIKPEFYYINALQLTTKLQRHKHFFAEFNGLRDLCFLRLDQLVRAFQEGKKKELTQAPVSAEELKQQALVRRRSYKILANQVSSSGHSNNASSSRTGEELASFLASSSATGSIDMDDEEEEDDGDEKRSHVAYSEDQDESMSTSSRSSSTSSTSDDGSEPLSPLPADALLSKMTTLLDCELRSDIQNVYESLWSNTLGKSFLRDHMEKTLDIDIEIDDWQEISSADNHATLATGFVISKENDYTHFRHVRSQHPPKTKFPGLPAFAGCCRLQRLRVEKATTTSTTGGPAKWTRFVVSELLRMSKIPFSDYFEIETRWVVTRDGTNYCHVQVGLVVNFLKSTWFKSQIDSSTRSESKEGFEIWAKNALVFLKDHPSPSSTTSRKSNRLVPPLVPQSPASPRAQRQGPDESVVVSAKRKSVTHSSGGRRASSSETVMTSSLTEASHTTVSSTSSSSFFRSVLASSALAPTTMQSAVQWLTLVLLLYCVVVIQSQQRQLQQLSEMTARLETQLKSSGLQPSTVSDACERSVVDGALTALQDFFAAQQIHHL